MTPFTVGSLFSGIGDSLALDVKAEYAKHGKTRLVLEVWS